MREESPIPTANGGTSYGVANGGWSKGSFHKEPNRSGNPLQALLKVVYPLRMGSGGVVFFSPLVGK